MKRRFARVVLIVVFVLILFGPGLGLFEVIFAVLLGWAPALERLAGSWHPQPASLMLFGLGAALLVVGSHLFMRWLARWTDRHSPQHRIWKWRWTVSGLGIGFCVLSAMGAAMLITHQLYWLSVSSEPWFLSNRERVTTMVVARELLKEAEAAQWETAATRAAFWQMPMRGRHKAACESLRPIWVERDEKSLRAVLLVPRTIQLSEMAVFALIQPDGKGLSTFRITELSRTLASFGIAVGSPAPERAKGVSR